MYFFKLLSEYNNPYQIYLLLRSKKRSFKVDKDYLKNFATKKTIIVRRKYIT